MVSINAAGTGSGNSASGGGVIGIESPSFGISADGNVVTFVSYASDLHPLDTNGTADVFARNLVTGTTSLVSVNAASTGTGNGSSTAPVLSADGTTVVFNSAASNLIASDFNTFQDVFAAKIPPASGTSVGDYSSDGATDAADYVLWRKAVGVMVTPFTGADGDGDGVIGQGDYGVWRSHFGAGGAGTASGASGEFGVGSGAQGGVWSGEGVQSMVEGRGSSAGALVQASPLNSNEMAVDALGVMPVSERLAHVAASLRDADGSVQAGGAAIWEVELSDRARGALAEPVARGGVKAANMTTWVRSAFRRNAATMDAALVAWLSSCRGERYQDDNVPVDGVRGSEPGECSSFEFADAVFAGLKGTLP